MTFIIKLKLPPRNCLIRFASIYFYYYYSTLLLKYPIKVTKTKIIIRNQMINFSIEKIEPK